MIIFEEGYFLSEVENCLHIRRSSPAFTYFYCFTNIVSSSSPRKEQLFIILAQTQLDELFIYKDFYLSTRMMFDDLYIYVLVHSLLYALYYSLFLC